MGWNWRHWWPNDERTSASVKGAVHCQRWELPELREIDRRIEALRYDNMTLTFEEMGPIMREVDQIPEDRGAERLEVLFRHIDRIKRARDFAKRGEWNARHRKAEWRRLSRRAAV